MDNQREFLGIWIPREIWFAEDLTIYEKVIYAEICSFDGESGCNKSNEYFINFTGASERTVQYAISSLKEKGYIKSIAFNGRERIIRVVKPTINLFKNEGCKICGAGVQNLRGRGAKFAGQGCNAEECETLKSVDKIKEFYDLPKTEKQEFDSDFFENKERKEEKKKEEKEKAIKEKEEINKEEKKRTYLFPLLASRGRIVKGGEQTEEQEAKKTVSTTYAVTMQGLATLLENEPIELRDTIIEFVKMRKAIKKPLTEYALKLALARLHKLGRDNIDTMIAILDQSISNSWQGLFELRQEYERNNNKAQNGKNGGVMDNYEAMLKLLEEEN